MDRREFLSGASAMLAAALVSEDAFAAPLRGPGAEGVEGWLAGLDLDRMRRREPLPLVREALEAAGLPPHIMGETFATLSLVTAWQGCDEQTRQHPALVEALMSGAALLARRCAALVAWLDQVPREEQRQIGGVMARPNRAMALWDRVLIRKGAAIDPRRRRALRGAMGDLARVLRHREATDLIDGLVGGLKEAARLERVDLAALAEEPEPTEAQILDGAAPSADERATRLLRLGLRLLGLGAAFEAGGWLLFYIGGASGFEPVAALGVVSCALIGPLLLLTGVVVLLVGVMMRLQAQGSLARQDAVLAELVA